jgi:hypothetical protein
MIFLYQNADQNSVFFTWNSSKQRTPCEKPPSLFGVFPIFVPSLSWQIFEFCGTK